MLQNWCFFKVTPLFFRNQPANPVEKYYQYLSQYSEDNLNYSRRGAKTQSFSAPLRLCVIL